MAEKAFQEHYPDESSYCYGSGRLNEHGLQIKSYWDGDETVCVFHPRPYHMAIPGYVYGGLIASLIDCHGTGTAASTKHLEKGKVLGVDPLERFVTVSLHVDYLAPTPVDQVLELRGRVKESKGRKMVIAVTLSSRDKIRARGEVVAIQVPEDFFTTPD